MREVYRRPEGRGSAPDPAQRREPLAPPNRVERSEGPPTERVGKPKRLALAVSSLGTGVTPDPLSARRDSFFVAS